MFVHRKSQQVNPFETDLNRSLIRNHFSQIIHVRHWHGTKIRRSQSVTVVILKTNSLHWRRYIDPIQRRVFRLNVHGRSMLNKHVFSDSGEIFYFDWIWNWCRCMSKTHIDTFRVSHFQVMYLLNQQIVYVVWLKLRLIPVYCEDVNKMRKKLVCFYVSFLFCGNEFIIESNRTIFLFL